MINLFLIIFCLLSIGSVNAQDTLFLKGKLVDANNLNPIANATIKIGTDNVLSDKLGLFSIQVLSDNIRTKGVDIEASGFHSLHLSDINDSTFLYLTLSPLIKSYSENVSVSFGGKDMIRRVYENIPKNYATEPFNQAVIQFTQTHIDDTAYVLNDFAKLKFYNSGYNKKKYDYQIQLIQNKQILKDFSTEMKKNKEALNWQLIGMYETFTKMDIVLNGYYFLDTSKWGNYTYQLLSKTKWKERTVYPIRFSTIDSTIAGNEGIIWVDSATYAVLRANLHSNWVTRKAISKRNKGSDFFKQENIQYAYDGNKWRLESVHSEGYQVRTFHQKNHQFDFIIDAVNYPENYTSAEKIPFFKRVIKSLKLSSFNNPSSEDSWKPILDFIHTDTFQKEYPWLTDLGW